MDTSTIENELWFVHELSESEDPLETLKAFFACAFLAGARHSREFLSSKDEAGGRMDEILEREWDHATIAIRSITSSGAVAAAKADRLAGRGFDA